MQLLDLQGMHISDSAAKPAKSPKIERQPLSPANRDPLKPRQPGKMPLKQTPPSKHSREAAGKLDMLDAIPALVFPSNDQEEQTEVLLHPVIFLHHHLSLFESIGMSETRNYKGTPL